MHKLISYVVTVLLIHSACIAQQAKISGKITSENELGVAVISLLNTADSNVAKSTLTEASGSFEFEQVKEGSYFIEVSATGYAKYRGTAVKITSADSVTLLPVITLQSLSKDLQEVTITAKKLFVERKIDRVLVNPDALIGNAGATSLEMLEKSPGVLVDVNGNISLKGKSGVVVFIDDKPTYLSAADLAAYLRSLPASQVETIELMTNPPAKYDAAGNAGVINIKMKKNRTMGFSGGVNLSWGQGRYSKTNNSANFSYRINKLNFFSNFSINQNNRFQDLTINRMYYTSAGVSNSAFMQRSLIKGRVNSNTAKLGLDYYANDKTTLGLALSGFVNPIRSTVANTASILNNNNVLEAFVEANSRANKKWKNGSINLNYNYKIDNTGRELFANIDYIHYSSAHSQSLLNAVYDREHLLQDKTILQSNLPSSIAIKTAKLDYSQPVKDGKLEAGIKSSIVNTDNTADFFDVMNAVAMPNYEFSNRFKYKENINALYGNYTKDWKQFSVQAGLRLENTNVTGNQLGNPVVKDSNFTNHYTSLFPTIYLAWRLDTTNSHQLSFSFGRRIDRPNYQDMNPFTYPLDRYTYYGGNPFLKPTYSYNFELAHTYRNKITTTFEFSIVDNLIQETNEQRNTIYYSRPGNFGRQTVYGVSINGTFSIANWWTLQLYSECKNLGYKSLIYGQVLDENRFYWYVAPTNQFVITKNLSAELAGSYQTRILVAQFLTTTVWEARAGLALKILKGKGTLKLNVSDLFYTNQPGGDIRNIANSKANWLSYLDSRVSTLSFSYRFNKGKALAARQAGASDTEKGRVKAQ